MSARGIWLVENMLVAVIAGAAVATLLGARTGRDMAFALAVFVAPAAIAAALATAGWGWRRLDALAPRPAAALWLSAQLSVIGFIAFGLLLAGVVWPGLALLSPSTMPLDNVLGQSLFVGLVAVGVAAVLGGMPALLLCWWTTWRALRRKVGTHGAPA